MSLCKILDTCTMINIFVESGVNCDGFFRKYESVTTPHVVEEYTRKYPRVVPDCLNVIDFDKDVSQLYDDSELLFPGLGPGERSAFVLAISMLPSEKDIVILSDDKKAVKKMSEFCTDEDSLSLFPGIDKIRWGNTSDVLHKMNEHGDITQTELGTAFQKLNFNPM
ncbi:MAG: hypothetical protein II855_06600 [Candidatus Methanomethylophilaceae archaeon]|nr:hypothetical protein [Candidatus Methanomethylophilaceae archaeon]